MYCPRAEGGASGWVPAAVPRKHESPVKGVALWAYAQNVSAESVTMGELMGCKFKSYLHSKLFPWQEWLSFDVCLIFETGQGMKSWNYLFVKVSDFPIWSMCSKRFLQQVPRGSKWVYFKISIFGSLLLVMACRYLNPSHQRSWKQNLADRTRPTCARAEEKQACLVLFLNDLCIKSLLSRHLLFPVAWMTELSKLRDFDVLACWNEC